jgi:hypothetical protein
MTELTKRFRFGAPAEFLNPLAQIFFAINLIDGLSFLFFSGSSAVQSIGFAALAPHLVVPFGVLLLVVSLLNVALLVTNRFYWGTAAAMLGFLVWVFATVLYLTGGLYLAMLIHPLPQVAFWAWYFFAVKRLKEK